MSNLSLDINLKKQHNKLFWGMTIISVLSIITATLSYSVFPILIPFALLGLYVSIVDIRLVFFGLIGVLAFSTEVSLPGGVGIDLPGEPLMIFITGTYLLLILVNPKKGTIPLKNKNYYNTTASRFLDSNYCNHSGKHARIC